VTSLVLLGGAVLGGLALKKKLDERRESRNVEMRAKVSQSARTEVVGILRI